MKIVLRQNLITDVKVVEFSTEEKVILRRAQKIAEDARQMLRLAASEIEAEQLDGDTDLAHVEHGCSDIIEGVMIEYTDVSPEQSFKRVFSGS